MADTPEPSEEQVEQALKDLITPGTVAEAASEPEPEVTQEAEPAKPAIELAEAPAETSEAVETTEEPAAEDDLESLQARLQERDDELKSVREKAAQSTQWARDGFLRRSDQLARAKQFLTNLKSAGEVDTSKLDEVLAGMTENQQPVTQIPNPLSPPTAMTPDVEANALAAQAFLFQSGMNDQDAQEFVQFMQDPASGVAQLDQAQAVLEAAQARFDKKRASQDTTTAKAVKVIAKQQKRAMRAASTVSGRASPSPPPEPATDLSKMSTEEVEKSGLLDKWIKQSMEDR